MDDLQMQACNDATATVARGFEPVRIEWQLLVRAFELVCAIDLRTPQAPEESEQVIVDERSRTNVEGSRAA